jgi:hypothetical protein
MAMTKEEALEYCYKHRGEFVNSFSNDGSRGEDGNRQFDCLIECIESGTIEPHELSDYGMDFDSPEIDQENEENTVEKVQAQLDRALEVLNNHWVSAGTYPLTIEQEKEYILKGSK